LSDISCPVWRITFACVNAGFGGFAQAGGLDNIRTAQCEAHGGKAHPMVSANILALDEYLVNY
jgi:hypothetical protein